MKKVHRSKRTRVQQLSSVHAWQRLKPKHSRPYRKRHLLALVVLVALCGVLVVQMMRFAFDDYRLRDGAFQAGSNEVNIESATRARKISSSLGFELTYDQKIFTATASEATANNTNRSFEEDGLDKRRAYELVRLTPRSDAPNFNPADSSSLTFVTSPSAINLQELKKQYGMLGDDQLVAKYFEEKSSAEIEVTKISDSTENIGDVTYQKQVFKNTSKIKLAPSTARGSVQTHVYSSYSGGHAYAFKISGFIPDSTPIKPYEDIIASLRLTARTAALPSTAAVSLEGLARRLSTPVRSVLGWQLSRDSDSLSESARSTAVVARNLPAVAKVYHIYCGNLVIDIPLGFGCGAVTGSGFFITSQGHLATNGHVVSVSAKDVVASTPQLLVAVMRGAGLSQSQALAILSDPTKLSLLIQEIYALPDERITFKEEQHHYVVALGKEVPDVDAIVQSRSVPEDTLTIKKAELIAVDYDSKEVYTTNFNHSDVAILKLAGRDYPIAALGNLDTITQGAGLTVIGFPAAAENSITDNSELKATATTGIVSAVRNNAGSAKRVIQSDVKISGGNSGGPAVDSNGAVVGVATYTFAGGEAADGTISYMRDIRDLVELAAVSDVVIDGQSKTQELWEDGLELFFNARYSAATKKFGEVKRLYPAHSLADEYIRVALIKIQNGEEATSPFNWLGVASALIASLGAVAATLVMIIRHHGRHQLYQTIQAGGLTGPGRRAPSSYFRITEEFDPPLAVRSSRDLNPKGRLDQ